MRLIEEIVLKALRCGLTVKMNDYNWRLFGSHLCIIPYNENMEQLPDHPLNPGVTLSHFLDMCEAEDKKDANFKFKLAADITINELRRHK